MIRTVLGLSKRFMLELRGYEYPFYVDDGTASSIARLFVHCPELPANLRTTSTTAVTRISEVLRFRVSITFLAGIRPYFIDSSSIQPSIISKVALERSAQVDSPNWLPTYYMRDWGPGFPEKELITWRIFERLRLLPVLQARVFWWCYLPSRGRKRDLSFQSPALLGNVKTSPSMMRHSGMWRSMSQIWPTNTAKSLMRNFSL